MGGFPSAALLSSHPALSISPFIIEGREEGKDNCPIAKPAMHIKPGGRNAVRLSFNPFSQHFLLRAPQLLHRIAEGGDQHVTGKGMRFEIVTVARELE
jgi:hypothetical protein